MNLRLENDTFEEIDENVKEKKYWIDSKGWWKLRDGDWREYCGRIAYWNNIFLEDLKVSFWNKHVQFFYRFSLCIEDKGKVIEGFDRPKTYWPLVINLLIN